MQKMQIQHKKLLKRYLGNLAVAITPEEIKYCRENIKALENYCFIGNREKLLKTACFMLLNFGFKKYEFYKSMEIVDLFLCKNSYIDAFEAHSPSCELLIIYHFANTPAQAVIKIEEIINYYISERAFSGLPTIVLSETNLKSVKNNSNVEYISFEEQK